MVYRYNAASSRHGCLEQIVRETNRKETDVRHECKLSPNFVYKNFTSQEVEAGLAIMVRAGLDRDNLETYNWCGMLLTGDYFIESL